MTRFVAVFDKDSFKFIWGMTLSSYDTARGYALGVLDSSGNIPFVLPNERDELRRTISREEYLKALESLNVEEDKMDEFLKRIKQNKPIHHR